MLYLDLSNPFVCLKPSSATHKFCRGAYKWDPLHLSDMNWPRDEYRSYLARTLELAVTSESHHPIAEYLTHMATNATDMGEHRERDEAVAELIFAVANDSCHFAGVTVLEV